LITLGILAVIQVSQFSAQVTKKDIGLTLGFALLSFLANCYVELVYVRQCLYTARGGTGLPEGLLLPPVLLFMRMIGVVFVFTCIVAVPVLLVRFEEPLESFVFDHSTLWFVVKVVSLPLICLLGTRLLLAHYFLVDRNTDILDAFIQAWHVSSNNFWTLFCVLFVLYGVLICWIFGWAFVWAGLEQAGVGPKIESIPGKILASIGLFPIVLFPWLGCALAYLQLTGQETEVRSKELEEETKSQA